MQREGVRQQLRFSAVNVLCCLYLVSALVLSLVAGYDAPGFELQQRVVLRFAVASDGHYGQERTPYQGNYSQLINKINQLHGKRPLAFVVILGDLVHDKPDQLHHVKVLLDRLDPEYYVVHGNHDHANAWLWKTVWGYPINERILAENYQLLLINTADPDGTYRCADAQWVRSSLAQPGSENIFIFSHITQGNWTRYGVNCPEIMENYTSNDQVRAVFHGHDHDVDHVKFEKEVPFVFTGRFGGSWGAEKQFLVVEMEENGDLKIYRHNIENNNVISEQFYRKRAVSVAKKDKNV